MKAVHLLGVSCALFGLCAAAGNFTQGARPSNVGTLAASSTDCRFFRDLNQSSTDSNNLPALDDARPTPVAAFSGLSGMATLVLFSVSRRRHART